MQILTKKTTILFSPELYDQLSQLAKLSNTSMAKLIRQAVIDRYLLSDKKKRQQAVKELSKIGAPISAIAIKEEEFDVEYLKTAQTTLGEWRSSQDDELFQNL